MKALALVLAAALSLAADAPPETIVTLKGDRFDNATVRSATPASLTLMHDGGVATVPFVELPEPIRARYGYDAVKAQAWLASVAEAKRKAAEPVKRVRKPLSPEMRATMERMERFSASGANMIYDPLTGQVYFSEAEAFVARRQLLRAAGAMGVK